MKERDRKKEGEGEGGREASMHAFQCRKTLVDILELKSFYFNQHTLQVNTFLVQ